jgi:hypothetical protein
MVKGSKNDVFIEKDKMKEERRLENIFREISSRLMGKKMGTELDVLPTKQCLEFKEIFSGFDFVNVSPLVLEQRKRKDMILIKHSRNELLTKSPRRLFEI